MTSTFRRRLLLAGALVATVPGARAQGAYPARTVQLIHGFGAGGNADVVARLLARKLQESMKQPVIVDIKSGAGGSIATGYVAKAAPDGYNLVLLTGAHTVSAALRKSLPYDAIKDFAFVSTVSSFPFVIAVRAEHPARTLAELLAIAKRSQIGFTSVGVGSTQHMVGELLGSEGGVSLLHVPYRGGGAPVHAVIGGDVDVLADTLTVATPHIESGRLRALAVTSAAPWPTLPGVPAVAATLPGFEVRSWLGIAAPAGTPAEIVQTLNAEIRKALQAPDVRKALENAGSAASPSTPEAMREMVQSDIARWRSVAARRGIQIE
jgi:tripartite-type tricarboxylate transporter receptor subunit TctC